MGQLLEKPVTTKDTEEHENKNGLQFGASAMQGWRMEMEDSHTIIPCIDELPDHSFIAVYDGHGGAFCASVAGKQVIEHVTKASSFKAYKAGGCTEPTLLESALRAAFLAMDESLKQLPEFANGTDRSGCTAIAAIITPSHLVMAHAGDSRAVFYSGDSIKARTNDHKPTNVDERARIEKAGGCVSMKRVDGDLAVSRALGDFQYKDYNLQPQECKVTAFAETQTVQRDRGGDKLLVMACDGVWDVMSDLDCIECVKEMMAEGETSVGLMCEELLDHCLTKGSRDNMSAVIVKFEGCAGIMGKGEGVQGWRRKRQEEVEAKRREEHEDSPP